MGKCAVTLDDGSCQIEFINETSAGAKSSGNRPTDVKINGSVGFNGKNDFEDVYKVQYAFNKVPRIDGGPPSPIAIDGKATQETIITIRNFQQKYFGFAGADGKVEPNKPTHLKLIEISSKYNVFPALPLDMGNDAWLFEGMMKHLPFVKQCIFAAQTKVALAMFGGLLGDDAMNLLNRHFSIDKNPSSQAAMQKIYDNYGYMLNVLNRPDNFFTLDTNNAGEKISRTAFARVGGFFSKDTDGRIVFRRGSALATFSHEFATHIFIHELKHFVEREESTGHFAFGWVTDAVMEELLPSQKASNCDTYANFALESKNGIMVRPGWMRTKKGTH